MDFLRYRHRYRHVPISMLLVALGGCTQQQNPQDLKEKTAQATAEVKKDAKAVAEGIREGWSRDKPLDLNTATVPKAVTQKLDNPLRRETESVASPWGPVFRVATRSCRFEPLSGSRVHP